MIAITMVKISPNTIEKSIDFFFFFKLGKLIVIVVAN
jgi:hypothetical protein